MFFHDGVHALDNELALVVSSFFQFFWMHGYGDQIVGIAERVGVLKELASQTAQKKSDFCLALVFEFVKQFLYHAFFVEKQQGTGATDRYFGLHAGSQRVLRLFFIAGIGEPAETVPAQKLLAPD